MVRFSVPLFVCILAFSFDLAEAQLGDGRVKVGGWTTYSPEDPFTRNKIFRVQTGHSGRFYNCDDEEAKRYSPYIEWTTVCNQESIRSWWNVLKCDVREVHERVRWGACKNEEECGCNESRVATANLTEVYAETKQPVPERFSQPTFINRGQALENPALKAKPQKPESRSANNQSSGALTPKNR